MKEQLISIETAKLAKQKGFINESRLAYTIDGKLEAPYYGQTYSNNDDENSVCYEAPSQSLLQKWLREVHNIHVYVHPYSLKSNHKMIGGNGFYEVVVDKAVTTWSGNNSWEEALEVGLQEALKLIK